MRILRMRSRSRHPMLIPEMELLRVRADCLKSSRTRERFSHTTRIRMSTDPVQLTC